jgi:heparan-alpha-glucosaminide N-acetyltransferase
MAKTNAPARASKGITERLVSLDAFRGFDILTMVFVNWCAGISGIPGWMKHMPSDVDGYTFVDLVFPAFLFIMGAAIPLAIEARKARGESVTMVVLHMLRRVAGLVLLGVVFVNLDDNNYNAAATGLGQAVWTLLFFTGAIVLWCTPPRNAVAARVHWYLRLLAVLGMGYLLFVFRRNAGEGATEWLKPEWWGILGLLGWSYLGCSIAYLVTRGNRTALMGAMALMLAVYIGDRHGSMPAILGILDQRLSVGLGTIFGSTAAITMAGVIVGTLFTAGAWPFTRPASLSGPCTG